MTSKVDQKFYNEISDKIQIAVNVISKSRKPALEKDPNRFVQTMCFYTGIKKEYINQAIKKMKTKKTFVEWLRFKTNSNKASFMESIKKIEYENLRKVIIDQYVNKQQIPTTASIIQAMKENMKLGKEYTPDMLKQDLYNLGFIWKRLPKSDKFIVVEKTEQFSRRIKYLHKMKEYRENNRILIHVERTMPCSYFISVRRRHTAEIIAVASPQLGLIDVYFPPKLQTLEVLLRNKLHTIPPNSVFVIEQSNPLALDWEPNCKLPTIHSHKMEMIKWLDAYDIPHDPVLHKAELYALIQKHKVHCPPLYKFCEILKADGHEVIFRPPELTYIKYFRRLMKPIFGKSNMTLPAFQGFVVKKMKTVNPIYFLREDQIMAEHEQIIYDEDLKLELILDRLMDNIKNGSLSESDLKECDSHEFDFEFLDNVVFDAAPAKKPNHSRLSSGSNPVIIDLEASKPGPVKLVPSAPLKPGPLESVKPGPSGSVTSRSSGSVMPGPSGSVTPGPSGSVTPSLLGSVQPGPSGSVTPGPSGRVNQNLVVLPSASFKPGLSEPGPHKSRQTQAQPGTFLLYNLLNK